MVHGIVRHAIGPDPHPPRLGKGVLIGAQIGEVPVVLRLLALDHLPDLIPGELLARGLLPIGVDDEDDQAGTTVIQSSF